MTLREILEKAGPESLDREVTHLCPDGYEDWVEDVSIDEVEGRVELSGYQAFRRKEREKGK